MFAEFSENSPKVFSYNDPDVANLNCTLYTFVFLSAIWFPALEEIFFDRQQKVAVAVAKATLETAGLGHLVSLSVGNTFQDHH